jgi:hypothetical protein
LPNRIRVALIASLTIVSSLLAAAPAGAAVTPQKVVIIVGPTGGQTDDYRSRGDSYAVTAEAAGATVVKVYSPNATWANVKAAVDGANIVIYIGHGNGFPNPYNSTEPTDRDNGWGLNRTPNGGDDDNWGSTMVYCGEQALMGTLTAGSTAQWNYCGGSTNTDGITPAPNWVMIYSNACYAPGASEGSDVPATEAVALQRVRNYSYPALMMGAGAYYATDFGANGIIDNVLRNPTMSFAEIAERANGYDLSAQRHFDHPDLGGYRIWIQNTGAPTSGSYKLAYAGRLGLTPSGSTVAYTEPKPPAGTTDFIFDVSGYFSSAQTGATYVPLTPARLLDSRFGNGLSGKFGANAPRTFQVSGRGGVPANAVAVTGNFTVTNQTSAGAAFLGPNSTPSPSTSTINFPVGDNRANGVTLALGPGGSLSATYMASSGTTDFVFDVTGYFVPDQSGSTYLPLTPARLLDSRFGNGLSGAFSANTPRTFQVGGRGGVPANAVAVTGNFTVTNQTSAGAGFLGPNATASPTTSTINFPVGDSRANGVTLALGAGGTLSATYMASGGSADFIFDVTGYFMPDQSGATYVPLTPARLLDSRYGNGLSGKFSGWVPRTFQVSGRGGVPSGAVGVTGNFTVTNQNTAGAGFLGPNSTASPTTSTINFPVGDNRANGVTVALGSGGTLSVTYLAY